MLFLNPKSYAEVLKQAKNELPKRFEIQVDYEFIVTANKNHLNDFNNLMEKFSNKVMELGYVVRFYNDPIVCRKCYEFKLKENGKEIKRQI